ncbi:MAG: type II toxin-antitoxin system Phd/YefM family antitoxin [Armatimonadetes bacterium]|nr:type II toxin-antitoxin system Phd/YefM family antitoxin [Armatimonadota bacterium]NCO95631.1 type II toxin-antitoxin system Phd/YefM family antitoxin [Armatimonadota bacterium]NCP32917.1 type II toxin-antitoxin system Phd/YefM family antitoxin [Armatimonadota bacterium]NCQ29589.1 type II toxin-antitoxin system Phd/YefM family antitoxin [Armatimonadota bacterium]NDK15996.1 type II toxin-antitoxin system Phd/YefM family antitoxin [Armatimonadota bacterium]
MKSHFVDYLRDCEREPILITTRGQPKAALVAVPEDEEERMGDGGWRETWAGRRGGRGPRGGRMGIEV